MKKIIIVALAFWIQGRVFSQTTEKQQDLNHEILIDLVQPLKELPVYLTMNIELTDKGSYFFKKSEFLCIPGNCTAVLEDSLTGNVFDLLSNEKHSFSISRPTSREFILRIREKKNEGGEVALVAK